VLHDPVIESMPIGFIGIDRDWRVTYVNATGEAVVGKTRQELVGASYWAAFPANVDNEFGSTYRAVMADGQARSVEAFYPEPLNRWFDVRAEPSPAGLSLYFTEVTARRKAQERLALLARVGTELAGTLDMELAASRIPLLLTPDLADGCLVTLVDEDGRLRNIASWHIDPDRRGLLDRYADLRLAVLPPRAPLRRSLRGESVVAAGHEVAALFTDGAAGELLLQVGPRWVVTVPLHGHARVIGAMSLIVDRAKRPDDADVVTAQEVGDRMGMALHNAALFEQQRQLAEALQRSLLSAPAVPDGVEIVVRYAPAVQAARVGGDWYDAFLQPSGATMLVIGDVVGHDVEAAAAMGQLRSMLRGLAVYSDAGPAEVLRGLDVAMAQLGIGTYATAAVARFAQTPDETAAGITRMRWSNAGHVPPLVIGPDGELVPLTEWRADLLLGVDSRARRSEAVVPLAPGSTVLLFTDGLLERRGGGDLDTGMARLRAVAAELADRPLPDLCDELIERLVDGRPEDDVALVAIRLHPQP
jgi:serine phosphatase RsbU (regulator of sigma subunit)